MFLFPRNDHLSQRPKTTSRVLRVGFLIIASLWIRCEDVLSNQIINNNRSLPAQNNQDYDSWNSRLSVGHRRQNLSLLWTILPVIHYPVSNYVAYQVNTRRLCWRSHRLLDGKSIVFFFLNIKPSSRDGDCKNQQTWSVAKMLRFISPGCFLISV